MRLQPLLTTLLALTVPAAHAQNVTLQSFTYTGTGCPNGTLSSYLSVYGSYYQTIDSFTTYIGPGTKPSDRRRTCEILANISASEPQQRVALDLLPDRTSLKGWANVDVKETLSVRMIAEWVGGGKVSENITIVGPSFGIWRKPLGKGQNQTVALSPCGGGQLKISLQASMTTTSSVPGGGIEPGDPSDDEQKWVLQNSLRAAPCA